VISLLQNKKLILFFFLKEKKSDTLGGSKGSQHSISLCLLLFLHSHGFSRSLSFVISLLQNKKLILFFFKEKKKKKSDTLGGSKGSQHSISLCLLLFLHSHGFSGFSELSVSRYPILKGKRADNVVH
jgi:hypothetical protein